jgi:hypothetical protein
MSKPTKEDADLLIKLHAIASKNLEAWQWLFNLEQMDYEAFINKYPMESEGFTHFLRIASTYELMGTLLYYEVINEDLLLDMYGTYWSKMGPIIKGFRKATGSPRYFENYEMMAKRRQEWLKKHPPKTQA